MLQQIMNVQQSQLRLPERYSILRKLGSGGEGNVYLCVNKKTQKKYAIKHVDLSQKKEKYILNSRREIYQLSKLKHKNIIEMVEYADENKHSFIVLELAKDGDLEDYLQKNPQLTELDKLHIVHQIAAGIKFFHGKGVIHRDLKPQNIFLDGKTVKIGDFGLARDLGNKQGVKPDTTRFCTVNYAAPELIRNKKEQTKSTDVWAFSAIMYKIFVGKNAFSSNDAFKL